MKRRSIKIDESMASRTAGSVIKRELMASDTYLRRLKTTENGITINNEHARATAVLKHGDEMSIIVSDAEAGRPCGKKLSLSILYEDEWLIIINKPAGMAVHSSTREPDMDTVEDALYYYLKPDERPHPVSRLDRGTTGVMTLAKSGYMHALIKKQMESGAFEKSYIAIVSAIPEPEYGKIELPIGFEEGSRYKRAIAENGSRAISSYKTIYKHNGMAAVQLIPETGRTHQLRLHMAAIGCPMVGDWLYGEASGLIARPALHAYRVSFKHPVTGQSITASAPPPDDMQKLLI